MVEITITLGTELYLRLMQYAMQIGMEVEDAAVTLLESAFPPLVSELDRRPVTTLSDYDLMHARDNLIDDLPSERAKWLRIWQQTGEFSDFEQIELQLWDQWYAATHTRKMELIEEIARRGLL